MNTTHRSLLMRMRGRLPLLNLYTLDQGVLKNREVCLSTRPAMAAVPGPSAIPLCAEGAVDRPALSLLRPCFGHASLGEKMHEFGCQFRGRKIEHLKFCKL